MVLDVILNMYLFQGFKVAYVVFANPEGVTKAKNTPFKKPLILSTEEHPLVTGVRSQYS